MTEQVGQYEIKGVLGGGGMATVYRGEHVSGIGMTAAIKKLHPHLAEDPVGAECRLALIRELEDRRLGDPGELGCRSAGTGEYERCRAQACEDGDSERDSLCGVHPIIRGVVRIEAAPARAC